MSQASGTKVAPLSEALEATAENEPTVEQVRQRAYEIYASRNGAPGDEVQDWLQAEDELHSK